MKRGIDVGNFSTKEYPGLNIKSLITTEANLLGSKISIELDGKRYFLGEGSYELELRKGNKENFLPLLYAALILGSNPEDYFQQVVCGLPINQVRANKEAIEDLVLSSRVKEITVNDESQPRRIIITDFKVYPEGVGAYYSLNTNEDLILVDIGGRTTDIAQIVDGKLKMSSTVAVGTLDVYKGIADKLNNLLGLALDIVMGERILNRGCLQVDGETVDLSFIIDILKSNFNKINDDLIMKFPARSEKIVLVGGGAQLFEKAFKKRYINCYIADEPVFANAIGFRKVAEMLWQ